EGGVAREPVEERVDGDGERLYVVEDRGALRGEGRAAERGLADHLAGAAVAERDGAVAVDAGQLHPAGADEHQGPGRLALGGDGVPSWQPVERPQREERLPALAFERGERRARDDVFLALHAGGRERRRRTRLRAHEVHGRPPLRAAFRWCNGSRGCARSTLSG